MGFMHFLEDEVVQEHCSKLFPYVTDWFLIDRPEVEPKHESTP